MGVKTADSISKRMLNLRLVEQHFSLANPKIIPSGYLCMALKQ
jgi:hypothetical protein